MEPNIQLFAAEDFRVRTTAKNGQNRPKTKGWYTVHPPSKQQNKEIEMTQEMTTQIMLRGMDSREIAQLAGKQHAHVCRDIVEQLGQLPGGVSRFGDTYTNPQNGQHYRCYVLPKRECLILATGYSVILRAKIIDRWAELEAAEQARQRQAPIPLTHKIPQTYAEALRLAADLSDKVESQAKQIEAAQPAVEFVGRYVAASGTQSLRGTAKILGVPEQAFIARLLADKILYRLSGRLMPAADQMQRNHFEVKTGEANGIAYAQPRVTPRGVEYLARRRRRGLDSWRKKKDDPTA